VSAIDKGHLFEHDCGWLVRRIRGAETRTKELPGSICSRSQGDAVQCFSKIMIEESLAVHARLQMSSGTRSKKQTSERGRLLRLDPRGVAPISSWLLQCFFRRQTLFLIWCSHVTLFTQVRSGSSSTSWIDPNSAPNKTNRARTQTTSGPDVLGLRTSFTLQSTQLSAAVLSIHKNPVNGSVSAPGPCRMSCVD
jgi:hypothetical protein